ncbi:MAG: HD-GYP domain-containing protein [Planctomycetia bacterium]|nr:HD-GYP domain-containing protein [Planctomycetia bacterium]
MTAELNECPRGPTTATRVAERSNEATQSSPELNALAELLGVPVTCYDLRYGCAVASTADRRLPVIPPELMWHCVQSGESRVQADESGLICFSLPFAAAETGSQVAVGYLLSRRDARPQELVLAAAEQGWAAAELDGHLRNLACCDPEIFRRHAALAAAATQRRVAEATEAADRNRIARQLECTYEEINLLHTLTQHMHVSHSPREIAELSLSRLATVIQAEGHAVWLDDDRDGRLFLIQGHLPFDEIGMARLVARFDGHDWPLPLLRNRVAGTLLGGDFPGLRNFVLVPIADRNRRFGWICSCNRRDDDFGTVQASLLASVASILGTHQRNLELFQQREGLLLAFVRSLVSTLDAKDAYTRGHSERVALIARSLGLQLGLPAGDLHDIYVSGLLHDIGKIGVDDQILRKVGPLTREELDQIKRHPVIGYNILAGLKNLQSVLPGVRHHHEAYRGQGYPDALQGEAIPLMARIIAVADSYDAMTSDRSYRAGLSLERLEEILREGAGVQWDPGVVDAYFAIRDEVRSICSNYSPSMGTLLDAPVIDLDDPLADPADRIDAITAALKLAESLS